MVLYWQTGCPKLFLCAAPHTAFSSSSPKSEREQNFENHTREALLCAAPHTAFSSSSSSSSSICIQRTAHESAFATDPGEVGKSAPRSGRKNSTTALLPIRSLTCRTTEGELFEVPAFPLIYSLKSRIYFIHHAALGAGRSLGRGSGLHFVGHFSPSAMPNARCELQLGARQ